MKNNKILSVIAAGIIFFAGINLFAGEIHDTAARGDLEKVKELVEKKADVNEKDTSDYNKTPLHLAVEDKDNLPVVEFLVEKGAEVDARDKFGKTPLLYAAQVEDNLPVVEYLVENGADVNAKDNHDFTPLYSAAYEGDLKVVTFLVQSRANVNATDKFGTTPLHAAAEEGHFSIVKFLEKNGANVYAKSNSGCTPILAATGHDNIVQYLANIIKAERPKKIKIALTTFLTPKEFEQRARKYKEEIEKTAKAKEKIRKEKLEQKIKDLQEKIKNATSEKARMFHQQILKNLKKQYEEEPEEPKVKCPICRSDFTDDDAKNKDIAKLPCNHIFHKECIFNWFMEPRDESEEEILGEYKNECPICRAKILD